MKHRKCPDPVVLYVLLAAACLGLAVPVAVLDARWLILPAALLVLAAVLLAFHIRRLRRFVAVNLGGRSFAGSKMQVSLAALPVPLMLLSDGVVIWYNDQFRDQVLGGEDAVRPLAASCLEGFDLAVCARPHGQDLAANGFRFTGYASPVPGGAGGALVYLINNTFYKDTLDEYTASRPAYLNIVIDSYDELFTDMKDSEQAHELEAINRLLEEYFSTTTGFLRKVSNNRYIAVIEERDLHPMIEGRFEILDKVRALLPSGMLTLSIGVGHGGKTLAECQEMARQSIDIALGRGGDQAAVKTADGFEFYGGVSHGVEKRSHVRSRIIANALADQIRQSDSVIIMGHRMSDLDAVGSAIGVLRMCKMCDVPAVIAVQQGATLAGALIDTFIDAGESHNFIEPRETLSLITPDTLLIVVDTYQKYLLESREIYEKCKRVVVIDHHRMAVGHIDNPVLLYHEPYASSASELVCELLQFMPSADNITPLEAQAWPASCWTRAALHCMWACARLRPPPGCAAAAPKPPRPSCCSTPARKSTRRAPPSSKALTSTRAAPSRSRRSSRPKCRSCCPWPPTTCSPSTAWTPASSPWPKTAASTSAPAAWARSTSRSFWRAWAAAAT